MNTVWPGAAIRGLAGEGVRLLVGTVGLAEAAHDTRRASTSRRLIEQRLQGETPISLLMAIPDHPWTKASKDSAAVRIAMTVAAAGQHEGTLAEVVSEQGLDTDEPTIQMRYTKGKINSDLTIGTDVTQAKGLLANEGLCSPGVKLHGDAFIVSRQKANELGLGTRKDLERHIRQYRNGRDLTTRPRNVMVKPKRTTMGKAI